MGDINKSQDNGIQGKIADNGLTVIATIALIVFAGFVSWFLWKALLFASPAIVPVLFGFFLALFFRPYYQFCLKLVRNPTAGLIVMLSSVLIPLSFLVWYAGALVADQVSNLISQGPELFQRASEWFRVTFPKFNTLLGQIGFSYENIGDMYSRCGVAAIKAGSGAMRLAQFVVSGIVTLVFFIFFLTTRERHGDEMVKGFVFLKEDTKKFIAEQIDAFTGILVSFFQRQAVICICEGLLYGAGFALVGLPCGFLVGFALGIINLVPFLGSLVCLPIALPLAYFGPGGSSVRLVSVLAVWLFGQFLDGYFITPKIQGDRTGLGYAGVIFSFFLWSTLLGPLLGMLLAIPLSAFCVVLWRALKSKYIRPVV
jgi:predicted PurR-regulated permease PerM